VDSGVVRAARARRGISAGAGTAPTPGRGGFLRGAAADLFPPLRRRQNGGERDAPGGRVVRASPWRAGGAGWACPPPWGRSRPAAVGGERPGGRAGEAVPLFAVEAWYREAKEAEAVFEGVVEHTPGTGRLGPPRRFNAYRLTWTDAAGKAVVRELYAPGK